MLATIWFLLALLAAHIALAFRPDLVKHKIQLRASRIWFIVAMVGDIVLGLVQSIVMMKSNQEVIVGSDACSRTIIGVLLFISTIHLFLALWPPQASQQMDSEEIADDLLDD